MRRILEKRYWILFLAFIFLAGAALAAYGFVPVMKIDGKTIAFSEYLKAYSAIKSYDKIAQRSATPSEEIKRLALGVLVENRFLDTLSERTSADFKQEAERLVEESIKTTPNLSLGEASKKIYGLGEADFKRLVLLPQAKRDLLTKHYKYNPAELETLWNDLAKNAEVKIYYPGYEWRGGEVQMKK